MTRLRQMLGQERGFALVIALAVTFVFSMTVVTVIEAATSNTRSSDRSKGRISAYSLAEAGINNAASILSKSNAYDPHVLHPQGTYAQQDCASPPANPVGAASLGNTCSAYSWTYDGGTTTMWGWFDSASSNWTISSTGSVRNAFGGANTTRTLSATIHVRAAPPRTTTSLLGTTSSSRTRLRASATSSSTRPPTSRCRSTSRAISASRTAPTSPRRTQRPDQPAGAWEDRLALRCLERCREHVPDEQRSDHNAKIAGGCGNSLNGTGHTCSPPSDYFYVKSGGYSTTANAISAPLLTNTDFTTYYNTAFIRPGDPCDSPGPNGATRLADSKFDNDTTALNGTNGNGSAASFDLTPSSSYTCEAKDNAGKVIGELSWDNTNKLLKIRGTIYIDGNVTFSQDATYQGVNGSGVHPSGDLTGNDAIGGQAVLYISGHVLVEQQPTLRLGHAP